MNTVLFNEKITENNYKEYVEQIMNVFRLSSYDKSILFSLRFEKADCVMQLSILNQDGQRQEYDINHIDSNDSYFYEFLEYLVSEFRNHCEITKEDIVNLDDDHYVAFRMITKYNDLITLDGLTESQANRFLKEDKELPEVKLSIENNTGGSNMLGFILMIITLIISIASVIYLVD